MVTVTRNDLMKISDGIYELSKNFMPGMRVPARVFSTDEMLDDILKDRSVGQLANVATLPGIQKAALAMPDIHEGYGFPIGGVAAMSLHHGGVISPGGIGYDINCGVRLIRLNVTAKDIEKKLDMLATELFKAIPSGVGRASELELKDAELNKVLANGARHMVELGYGSQEDLDNCEEGGSMAEAHADAISDRAKNRGRDQLGTLGSGNHFLEVQRVDEIFDDNIARVFGLEQDMVTIMIHCGSRGLGHQTCTDYVGTMIKKLSSWDIVLPDQELACAPFNSPEGQQYFSAMAAAANFAWANRHLIGHWVRQTCTNVLGNHVTATTVYDISHNMGKKEYHMFDGSPQEFIVHRKGATRAFPAGHPDINERYRAVGHPVFVPGTMGTSSYVLVGTQTGMEESFGSSCHGAGRRMSRTQAKHRVRGSTLREELQQMGIIIKSKSDPGLAEEAPIAYKDIDAVIRAIMASKIGKRVVRLKPIAVIKGD